MSGFILLLKRDLILANRNRSELFNPLLFFILVSALFTMGTTASPELLSKIAAGIIWVGALLASLLSIDSIFRSDYDDGCLEQWLLNSHSSSVLVLAKIVAHWLITGLPVILVTPLLALMLHLPAESLTTLMLTLLLGTPVLSLIGSIGVALTLGLRKGGMLLPLLILPFYVPVLIFANNAVQVSASGLYASAQITMLVAILVLAITLTPITVVACLKLSVE